VKNGNVMLLVRRRAERIPCGRPSPRELDLARATRKQLLARVPDLTEADDLVIAAAVARAHDSADTKRRRHARLIARAGCGV